MWVCAPVQGKENSMPFLYFPSSSLWLILIKSGSEFFPFFLHVPPQTHSMCPQPALKSLQLAGAMETVRSPYRF